MSDTDIYPSIAELTPRPSLKRIDNLQQKLLENSNAYYTEIEEKSTRQRMIEFLPFVCVVTAVLNLDLSSFGIIFLKVFLFFCANTPTLYYKTYQEIPKPLRIFPTFAVFILIQPLIMSTILFRSYLPLEEHTELHYQSSTNDALTLLVLLIGFWIKFDLPEEEIKAMAKAGSALIIVNSLILSTILAWDKPSYLIANFLYAIILSGASRLTSSRIALKKIISR